jgi:hypothetical protein
MGLSDNLNSQSGLIDLELCLLAPHPVAHQKAGLGTGRAKGSAEWRPMSETAQSYSRWGITAT